MLDRKVSEDDSRRTPVFSFLEGKGTETGSYAHYTTAVKDSTRATFIHTLQEASELSNQIGC